MQTSISFRHNLAPGRALTAAVLVLVLVGGGVVRGQSVDLWEGWHGPPADGIYGLRFGMDRGSVDTILRTGGLKQRHGRRGTLRYQGKISGVPGEIMAEFYDAGRHHRGLMGVQINWVEEGGRLHRMIKLFERLEKNLVARYQEPVFRQEASDGQLSTASGSRVRLYRGTEMEARLDLEAPDPETFFVVLRLKYPPIHPELAGR